MPKNQLLDLLFALFKEKMFWSVKDLRLRTEQPEGYLKEVLPDIASQHKSGPVCHFFDLIDILIDGFFLQAKWFVGAVEEL